ncbi:hypothetical protein [Burkholderia territorii]|uniref:hypothetical protein n=1 Tax=Burkholderia territorii TaxID=1503055 RepID=UPI0012D8A591|nr:hypothetical protein [Burkholderia territorii]
MDSRLPFGSMRSLMRRHCHNRRQIKIFFLRDSIVLERRPSLLSAILLIVATQSRLS